MHYLLLPFLDRESRSRRLRQDLSRSQSFQKWIKSLSAEVPSWHNTQEASFPYTPDHQGDGMRARRNQEHTPSARPGHETDFSAY